jgi:hypothetical protein
MTGSTGEQQLFHLPPHTCRGLGLGGVAQHQLHFPTVFLPLGSEQYASVPYISHILSHKVNPPFLMSTLLHPSTFMFTTFLVTCFSSLFNSCSYQLIRFPMNVYEITAPFRFLLVRFPTVRIFKLDNTPSAYL